MGQDSKIEWTHHTFNPWRGCTKVSPGCANCYADTLSKRNPAILGEWGPNGTRVVAAESYWGKPYSWDHDAHCAGQRHRVFCASLADIFEDWTGPVTAHPGLRWIDIAGKWQKTDLHIGKNLVTLADARRRLFHLIAKTPNLAWLLLTKRPENVKPMTAAEWGNRWPPNVWLGTSVENQEQADKRIQELLKVPAAIRFLSCEPLLGPVDLRSIGPEKWDALLGWKDAANNERGWANTSRIHWVIAGGESGHRAQRIRPMHPDWVRSIRDQCQAAGVPFFFKQWGEWLPSAQGEWSKIGRRSNYPHQVIQPGHQHMFRVGKKAAGRLLDGREWNEFPKVEVSP